MDKIVNLPFEIQAMLVAGYLAYRISITGIDRNIKVQDQIFQILVFGFSGLLLERALIQNGFTNQVVLIFSILFTSIFCGIAWRGFGRDFIFWALRKSKVHTANSYPNALETIIHGYSKLSWRYCAVTLTDGKWFKCDIAKVMSRNPPATPIFIDEEGSIGMYVTDSWNKDDGEKEIEFVDDGTYEFTYIPAGQIKQIDIGWRT